MRISLKRAAMLGIAVMGVAAAAPANAQQYTRAGILQCRGTGYTSYILGSVTDLSCVFSSSGSRPERYVATLRRFGADIGTLTSNALTWSVMAPTQQVGRGEIAGNYGGVGAAATVGVGGAVNVLIGGSNNSYALQPVSFQGSTGFNAAGGLAGLELRAVRGRRY